LCAILALFFSSTTPPPRSPLFPYTTLFRSDRDAIVVAPASADFLAKLAHGLADDLLSTLCLARDCPLFVAPAMNRQMWQNPATRSEEHTSELQLRENLVCRLLLEKKKKKRS